jgi:hypothetical protein
MDATVEQQHKDVLLAQQKIFVPFDLSKVSKNYLDCARS